MNAVRRKKLMWVMFTLAGAAVAVVLVIYAIGQQTDYYFDATAIAQGEAPQDKRIRAGGMVVAGSVQRAPDNPLNVEFAITDFESTVPVTYQGILPDLFAENSGIVATGKMQGEIFVAGEVLAKHDENYMPPEVAKSMKENNRSGLTPTSEQYNPAEPIHETETLQQ
ncbi:MULTISPECIES: cytochrome c maturation protein CcmE [unclassified Psychrobacter]|uniref:cytochrome c maturation protein CcmE n=1 Tax=unclassified Psychrobacter TaxID=196806 RepID=UPI00078D6A05|nr:MULTISPECIES: cytochrome c maturation protein CcmE [unclassified Psychrobacter]AMN50437.1 cytochrome C biogenesis protein CcmE [Psychrobacter sp. P2G3]AMN68336.1 cytochrome C biogenesis protein CcmE [Psychrobacter sp. P11G5]